jgi:hypothetical protein
MDEYDKPILDNIDQPEVAAAMREGLKNLYSVLKGQDAHLQFVFMTGVTKLSKVSFFCGMNQFNDITLDTAFSSICGYTKNDLQQAFGAHLAGVDLAEVRRWYNGYNWTGPDTVYNPFDILLFVDKGGRFYNDWFETGNPSFLLQLSCCSSSFRAGATSCRASNRWRCARQSSSPSMWSGSIR